MLLSALVVLFLTTLFKSSPSASQAGNQDDVLYEVSQDIQSAIEAFVKR
jgi:hypothetical protein